jgi:hypothetical protein
VPRRPALRRLLLLCLRGAAARGTAAARAAACRAAHGERRERRDGGRFVAASVQLDVRSWPKFVQCKWPVRRAACLSASYQLCRSGAGNFSSLRWGVDGDAR